MDGLIPYSGKFSYISYDPAVCENTNYENLNVRYFRHVKNNA